LVKIERVSAVARALGLIALAGLASCGWPAVGQYDVLMLGGTVVDGTGRPAAVADVGIRGDRIARIGAIGQAPARTTIDATGLVVAPGFVDTHNHSERAIADPARRLNEAFVRQGVTTIVGGSDGSASPSDIRALVDAYERQGIGTNVAFHVGHNAVRREAMGDARLPAGPADIERMEGLVREGMELGALGLSTGLMYEPGMFASTDEVIALAKVVQPFGGIYDSHVRNPAHDLIGSDREAIEIGEQALVPVKIAHEKAVGLENAGLIADVIELVEAARRRGLNVVTDQYPYDGAATSTLDKIIVVPPAVAAAPGFELRAALRNPATRRALQAASEQGIDGGFAWLKATGYSHMRITACRDWPELVGRHLSELAEARGLTGFDLVADLVTRATSPVGITLGAIAEADVRELLVQPWNMVASDGAYADADTPGGHPRSTGTFPRVLGRYVRDEGLLTLEEAIRKMTSFPADFVGLQDRGRVAVDKAADLTLFDPRLIADRSTWAEPNLMAEGVRHVLVNGILVLEDGRMTGAAPGRHLERRR
jgi:N-acyl-D-aspartate/D-glutamate deacylase